MVMLSCFFWCHYDDQHLQYSRFLQEIQPIYMVGFIAETNMSIPRAYQLFITPKGRTKNVGIDVKIGQTISEIVKSFFKNKNNVLVYICDTSDRMQAARNLNSRCGFSNIQKWKNLSLFRNVWR